MIAVLARSSQLLNIFLAGSLLATLLLAPGGSRPLVAQAQEPPADSRPKPPVPTRPEVLQLLPLTGTGSPPAVVPGEPKGDSVVPPIVRKRPPPGQTSVPIVSPVKRPQPVAGKKGPVQPPKVAKGKAPPAGPRAGLGVKPATVKCTTGQRYDTKVLKCVQGPAIQTPAAAATPPAPLKAQAAKSLAR